jgi:hypothetical protein
MMWIILFCYLLLLTVGGYLLPYIRQKSFARLVAWLIAIVTVFFSTVITWGESPLMRMFVIVFLQLLSMKVVVMVESYSGRNGLNVFQWVAFSLGWFGMRPVLFEKLPAASLTYRALLVKGLIRIVIGVALIYVSILISGSTLASKIFFPQLLLLVGLSFILHFGLLNISTAMWRRAGVDVQELFRSPYRSRSLKEFWGKRWNLAFSEMTAVIAFRPLKEKIGSEKAVALSFLLSGLLHEIAISLPVKAGYGLPMLYFLIHAVAMQLESKFLFVQNIVRHRVWSHVWVMGLLVLPMPLLFHRAFIDGVLRPLAEIIFSLLVN